MTEQRQNIPAKRWTCKHWHSGQHANASEPCGYCALEAEVEALRADRDEWRQQHENLLAVRQQDLAVIQKLKEDKQAQAEAMRFVNRQRPEPDEVAVYDAMIAARPGGEK